jgi:hypothetical protein
VRQRIHTRGRGDIGRQTKGELRVFDDDGRKHARMKNDSLRMRPYISDDGCASHFRSGAGSGGHCNDGRHAGHIHAGVPVFAIFKIEQRALLSHHQRDGLAGIERAAAAERDHAIVTSLAKSRHTLRDALFLRIALQL